MRAINKIKIKTKEIANLSDDLLKQCCKEIEERVLPNSFQWLVQENDIQFRFPMRETDNDKIILSGQMLMVWRVSPPIQQVYHYKISIEYKKSNWNIVEGFLVSPCADYYVAYNPSDRHIKNVLKKIWDITITIAGVASAIIGAIWSILPLLNNLIRDYNQKKKEKEKQRELDIRDNNHKQALRKLMVDRDNDDEHDTYFLEEFENFKSMGGMKFLEENFLNKFLIK